MFNLRDKNLSYIIVSIDTNNIQIYESISSVLYSKDYTIIPINSHSEGKTNLSYIGISICSDDEIRSDSIYIMDKFQIDSVIVKYNNQSEVVRIYNDGSEKNLELTIYDSNLENRSYFYDGISFTFTEKKRFFFPKKKDDLKNGMIVEYFNNNKWTKKEILNINIEYDRMFKLLMKYEKLRIECNY